MLFAGKEFELSTRQEDGSTLRENYELAYQLTGDKPDQLEMPEFPETLFLVWSYFLELNNARTSNGFGANPLTYSEIAAWDSLTGAGVTPSEVQVIKQLDNVYLRYQAEQSKKNNR